MAESSVTKCGCGREFAKSFGLRVHQRTCSAVVVPTPERHRDGPDQRLADLPDPMANTFDPKEDSW